ncbi:MAG: 50S ribosomal protein L11 methyltransferase [Candidatus Thorarchaeota archaeon]
MMTDREFATPFPILQAVSLLSHKSRIRKFKQAIERVVKPNNHVIDVGTGSGILAIIAARYGARVTAIDANVESLKYARDAAKINGVADKIEFVNSHFSDFKPKEKADVAVCEMLSSVMLIEQQIPASQYVMEHLLKPNGTLIPEEVKLFVIPVENEILWNRFNVENLTFPRIPQTADRGQSIDLADMQELERYDFSKPSVKPSTINKALEFEIVRDGTLNGLTGMFEARLHEDIKLSMEDGWRELFLPLPKPIEVKTGDSIRLRLSFRPGEYDSLCIEVE